MLLLGFLSFLVAFATAKEFFVFNFGESYSMTASDFEYSPADDSYPNPQNLGTTSSGGANWVDVLINKLVPKSTRCFNNAMYGAVVNGELEKQVPPVSLTDMVNQVKNFRSHAVNKSEIPWSGNNAVFSVWFGISDVFATSQDEGEKMEGQIFDTYFSQLQDIYDEGGRNFLILGMPSFNRAPQFMTTGKAMEPAIKKAIVSWNKGLGERARKFQKAHPEATLVGVDTMKAFDKVLDNPKEYGAPNAKCVNMDGKSCLWADALHPGLAIQNATAYAVYSSLQKMGLFGTRTTSSVLPTGTGGSSSTGVFPDTSAGQPTNAVSSSSEQTGAAFALSMSAVNMVYLAIIAVASIAFLFL